MKKDNIEFNKAYNRQEFVNFLHHFLPNDLTYDETHVKFNTKMNYTRQVVKLGSSESLDLIVYEVRHNSKNDARVSLSKEAFRLLADEQEDRALVVFVPEDNSDNYRFSLIEITLEAKDDSSRVTRNYSNPRRYSYFLGEGIACYTPNKYLNGKGRVVNPDDLRSRFSVEVLTKEFYQELSDWYAWAIKIIRFPNDLNDRTDDDKFNHESAIRLITRLIFVWFLKQRHLVPEEFFDEDYLRDKLLKDFKPYQMEGLLHDVGEVKYYTAILQNLFFAMLNSPITPEGSAVLSERHFRKLNEQGKPDSSDRDNNKLMRYESYFKNPQLFVDLANSTVPFLNGGLFDCLDDKDNKMYYDGFSDNEKSKKSLYLPDFLFFIPETDVDLSVWYNDKKKAKTKVRGLIQILKRYNFTVEENTPFDQEVSLDPELLGKVFENLLASYNPETQTTARKQTGSFYTPREIVQYMVDESLVAHLKRTVGDELEEQYRQLMRYTDEEVRLTDAQRKQIMQSLYHCKVLDPACGSGAFPVGMLQQMVHILNRIDPDNVMWEEMMRKVAIDETSEVYRTASSEERREMVADIERSFDASVNRPDYARKLYLIENCIYGIDNQPIAIQISKLRFFISLVIDQKTNDNPAENFGIRPLPNLEAKFVAANTLIGLDKKDSTLFDTPEILVKKKELKVAKHKIFGAKTVKTKRKHKEAVNRIRQEIAELLRSMGAIGESEATVLASWDMFDQNASSPFFDPEWMFDIKGGFDIVIGNPPYIDSETMTLIGLDRLRHYIVENYKYINGNWDIYMAFFEKGLALSNNCMCYITPDKWLSKPFGKKFRAECMIPRLSKITRVGNNIFENVTVDAIITSFIKKSETISAYTWTRKECARLINSICSFEIAPPYYIDFLFSLNQALISKIERGHAILASYGLCENACATADAYNLIPLIYNSPNPTKTIEYKLVNTGTIDKFCSKWGEKGIKYLGLKMLFPVVDINRFISSFGKAYVRKTRSAKIILKGLNLLDAFVDEEGEYIPGKTTLVICSDDIDLLRFLCSLINSKLMLFYIKQKYSSSSYCGGITFTKDMINNLPVSSMLSNYKEKIVEITRCMSSTKQLNREKELNFIIYKSYGLAYDEVLIVDPQTPITREEYEKGEIINSVQNIENGTR